MASRYPFEYFCGANVVVYLDDFPLLEASGFSFSIRESKRPIYGYASRLYDAVARGQVLVEGTLLINYVHQDYLFQAAKLALKDGTADVPLVKLPPVEGQGVSGVQRVLSGADASEGAVRAIVRDAQDSIWGSITSGEDQLAPGLASTWNLHDAGAFSIRAAFGNQGGDKPSGDTGFLLTGLHFTGRGQTIQIDAETIVEAYSFFARNVYSTTNSSVTIMEREGDGVRMTTEKRP